jgi:hypothetical protein
LGIEENEDLYRLFGQKTCLFALYLKIGFKRLNDVEVQSANSLILHDKLKYIDPVCIVIRKLNFFGLEQNLKLGVLILKRIIMVKFANDEGRRRHE